MGSEYISEASLVWGTARIEKNWLRGKCTPSLTHLTRPSGWCLSSVLNFSIALNISDQMRFPGHMLTLPHLSVQDAPSDSILFHPIPWQIDNTCWKHSSHITSFILVSSFTPSPLLSSDRWTNYCNHSFFFSSLPHQLFGLLLMCIPWISFLTWMNEWTNEWIKRTSIRSLRRLITLPLFNNLYSVMLYGC